MNCIVCNNKKNFIKESYFTQTCVACKLEIANLKNRFGAEVKGIYELRNKNFKKIISKILTIKKKPKILEIGSGDGMFVYMLLKKKINIKGIEPDQSNLREKFLKKFIIKDTFPLRNKKRKWKGFFDFIVFNDSLEHFKNSELKNVIFQSKKFLRKNGYLIINMPTSDGKLYKLSKFLYKLNIPSFFERMWQKNFSSPHQFYFNEKNLTKILKVFRFKRVYSGYLKVVDNKGLYQRIEASHKSFFIKNILFIIIYFLNPIINYLSKDINFLIFKSKT